MIRALPNLVPSGSTHFGCKTACGAFTRDGRECIIVKFLLSASFHGRVITTLNSLKVFDAQKIVETVLSLTCRTEMDIFAAILRQEWFT